MEPATYTNVKSEKFDALVEGNGSTLIALHGKTGLDTAFGQRQPHPAYPTHFTVRCYELTEVSCFARTLASLHREQRLAAGLSLDRLLSLVH